MGPMTGRAAGYCAGYNAPGYMNPAGGFGRGRGMGFGRGRGRGFGRGLGRGWGARAPFAPGAPAGPYVAQPYYAPAPEDEAEVLEDQIDVLEQQLKAVRQRLDEVTGEES